ncbi:uncharacterized protein BCR38DRAFT_483787 [Pseudomassariella vexata]|uniref:RRM domain-containing protein n=1 Tax=Pseudomassariella vexata TaxID=1141098 RepID=A0A1Y2E454_9PEZI|nr:uncharacterized protein BCR38DRAFT_483787 [Pseudomassariella vexata]ORY66134.1 hypothetical protein BCR38DRAFT_483787 [Pseudomassariella vexata]
MESNSQGRRGDRINSDSRWPYSRLNRAAALPTKTSDQGATTVHAPSRQPIFNNDANSRPGFLHRMPDHKASPTGLDSSLTPNHLVSTGSTYEYITGPNSPNYRGNSNNPENWGADIPVDESTALYLVNLPPTCTPRELLQAIRNVGKIHASSVSPPSGQYDTSAAKLVFWTRAAAEKFIDLVNRGEFSVNGYIPVVTMNKFKAPEQPASQHSRVLQVSGPSQIVQQDYLERFFQKTFAYDLDEFVEMYRTDTTTRLEVRFCSYRHQASNAYKYIGKAQRGEEIPGVDFTDEEKLHWHKVRVFWGVDPSA